MVKSIFNILCEAHGAKPIGLDPAAGRIIERASAMTNRTEKRALLAVCGAAMALASGCAPSMQYETPSSIALEPTTLETAREANAMLEDYEKIKLRPKDKEVHYIYAKLKTYYILLNHLSKCMELEEK